jgi:Ca-activated chloride channel family protein
VTTITLRGGNAQREAITTLGLRYSLLTNYTSFVAVDRVVRRSDTPSTPVHQPLPLPQGVANSAVGAAVPSTPEPAAWLALTIVLGLVVASLLRHRHHR